MGHERDELGERRAARLSPVGQELLAEIERSLEGPQAPNPEEFVERIEALPPNDQAELEAILSGMELEAAARAKEHGEAAEAARQAKQIIAAAQEQDRAAGRPVDENMTVAEALEKLQEHEFRTVPAYYPDFADAERWREYDGSPPAEAWARLMGVRAQAIRETVALVHDVAGEGADALGVAGELWNLERDEVAEIMGEPYEE